MSDRLGNGCTNMETRLELRSLDPAQRLAGMAAACNPSTWEADTGGGGGPWDKLDSWTSQNWLASSSARDPILVYKVESGPGRHLTSTSTRIYKHSTQ